MSQLDEQYWLKRLLHDSAKVYNFAEGQLGKLRREYEKAIKQIDRDLRTAKHTERIDKLKARLLAEIDRLMEYEDALTKDTLLQVYEEGFYRSTYNVQRALGYGTSAIFIGPQAAEIAVGIAWSGKNYSERIWQHRDLLAKKVEQILTKGTILGQSNAQMAKQLAEEMDNTFANAARLVRTETNYIHNQASKESYAALGVEQYQFLATLDLRTSDICASLDGKKFDLKKAQAGVNYPPMHPNCRSATVPVVEYDAEEVRLAKLNGTYYEVPATMTYDEWYQSIVKEHGADQVAAWKKMEQNVSKDRQLHDVYKKAIGVDAPQSFAAFQQIKYNVNDSDRWAALKRQRGTFEKVNNGTYSDEYKRKLKNTYRYFKKDGFEFTIHSLNRTIGQKQSKGKVAFTKEDIKAMLKEQHNFVQSDNGHLVRFKNEIAVMQATDTKEIVSIVTRKNKKDNWEEV
ncbi:minor capsid protein [Metasolibacillus meyeri]|uniref:minor capsid protein n=1 Tax=Metasolibacillus meyeri TaxID=1071052 RepID=UPI00187D20EA|nr:minor capsid protein [Metasolibacillus meyeri]